MEKEEKREILERLKSKGRIYMPDFQTLEEELETILENDIIKKKEELKELLAEKEELQSVLYNLRIA